MKLAVLVVLCAAATAEAAPRRVRDADRALAAQLLDRSPGGIYARVDGVERAVRVIDETKRRVHVAQDVGDARVAVWIERSRLVRVVAREVGVSTTRDAAAPTGDQDGLYLMPGVVVGELAGKRVAIHLHGGDIDVRGWVDADAFGDLYEAPPHGDGLVPAGTQVLDAQGDPIITVGARAAVTMHDLGGGRAALYGDTWIARGTLHLGEAHPPPAKPELFASLTGVGAAYLARGDCLFADDGSLAGVMRSDRYDAQVDADRRVTIVVDTAAATMTLHALPAGKGRFLSCAPER